VQNAIFTDALESVLGVEPAAQTRRDWQRKLGFPAPVKIGRKTFWVRAEIERWAMERAAERVSADV
jgi:hypothetical protein